MVSQNSRSLDHIFLPEFAALFQIDFSSFDLAIGFDHHWQLDETCRWHGHVAAMGPKRIAFKVVQGHGHVAFVILEQRQNGFFR